MEAGYRLRQQRKKLGLRLRHVAEAIGHSQSFVSNVERGLAGSPEDIERIAAFLRDAAEFQIPATLPCIE